MVSFKAIIIILVKIPIGIAHTTIGFDKKIGVTPVPKSTIVFVNPKFSTIAFPTFTTVPRKISNAKVDNENNPNAYINALLIDLLIGILNNKLNTKNIKNIITGPGNLPNQFNASTIKSISPPFHKLNSMIGIE